MSIFEKWNLESNILDAIISRGWTEPTEIQLDSIPLARKGRDIVGQAKTGSGKTAAFGIPIMLQLWPLYYTLLGASTLCYIQYIDCKHRLQTKGTCFLVGLLVSRPRRKMLLSDQECAPMGRLRSLWMLTRR